MAKAHKSMQSVECRTCGEVSTFSVAQLEALATRHCKRCGEPLEASREELLKTMREAAAEGSATDPAGLPALVDAIRHLHGVEATWLESVPVREEHDGKVLWEGEVQVFAVEHPKATRVYAWSHESGPGGKRRFHAVLGAPPVSEPVDAVRVAVGGELSASKTRQ